MHPIAACATKKGKRGKLNDPSVADSKDRRDHRSKQKRRR